MTTLETLTTDELLDELCKRCEGFVSCFVPKVGDGVAVVARSGVRAMQLGLVAELNNYVDRVVTNDQVLE